MGVPGSSAPLLFAATEETAVAYQIERSLRFNSSDSAYLSRTPASAGNRKTWTWAAWVKRAQLGARQGLFGSTVTGQAQNLIIEFDSSDRINIVDATVSGGDARTTTAVYRDPASWYHLVVAYDTTQATANNRVRLYVNGSEVTVFAVLVNPSQNSDGQVNAVYQHSIGAHEPASTSLKFNGLLADVFFIDGQALDPSSFTEVSATTGQLIPKAYTGSFGTNGFWLKFSDNSAATATTLGKDYSGNSNNWTPNNLSVFNVTKSGAGSVTAGSPFNSSFPWTTAFDGAIDLTGAVSNASGANSYVWTFANTLSGTTAAFVVHDTYVPDFDTGNKAAINGTALTSSNWTKTTNTLPVASGAAGDYKVYTYSLGGSPLSTVGVGNAVRIAAVLLDGIPLIFDLSGTNDSLVDTPTSYGTDTGAGGEVRGNYCTWNPLTGAVTLTNGNLDGNSTGGAWRGATGTTGVFSGKWYWESTIQNTDSGNYYGEFGFIKITDITGAITFPSGMNGIVYYARNGRKISGGTSVVTSSPGATTGDIVQVAVDLDAGKIWFGVNNTWIDSGNPASGANPAYTGLSGTYLPALGVLDGGKCNTNFGQRQWAYAAPAGFKALCDTNLPAPTIALPSTVMDVKLYTGNGSTQTISGLGFSPDLVWVKCRSVVRSNFLFDTVRGAAKYLISDTTGSEVADNTYLTAFTSDGFSVDSSADVNRSATPIVAWTWDAGTSTVTNTQGSITSQVRTNGYLSIVSYTAAYTGSARTVGHGLGVKPSLIILKNRSDGSANWRVYHSASGASLPLILNSTAAAASNFGIWDNTEPTSSVFTVGINTDVGGNIGSGDNLIAYCFSPVAGYSSFGSYTGNGTQVFVYTGFKPRWILLKTSGPVGGDWFVYDTARDAYNVSTKTLSPNLSGAEVSSSSNKEIDILSNGFLLRADAAGYNNYSGWNYIYAAFAENPFQYARAR